MGSGGARTSRGKEVHSGAGPAVASQSGPELTDCLMEIPGPLFLRTERSVVILLRSLVQNALDILSPLHQPVRVLLCGACSKHWRQQVSGQPQKWEDMEQRTPSHFSPPTVDPFLLPQPQQQVPGEPLCQGCGLCGCLLCPASLSLHLAECSSNNWRAPWGRQSPMNLSCSVEMDRVRGL